MAPIALAHELQAVSVAMMQFGMVPNSGHVEAIKQLAHLKTITLSLQTSPFITARTTASYLLQHLFRRTCRTGQYALGLFNILQMPLQIVLSGFLWNL